LFCCYSLVSDYVKNNALVSLVVAAHLLPKKTPKKLLRFMVFKFAESIDNINLLYMKSKKC
jgi:hypothetical protein